jgi:hypothetical protein
VADQVGPGRRQPDDVDGEFHRTAAPAEDAGLADIAAGLGLPGLIDVHVHLLPADLQRRVWRHFDNAGPMIGRPWPIRYRWPVPRLVEHLAAIGVRRFSTMPYAHAPGVAAGLNDYAAGLAAQFPAVLPSFTFFPEAGALDYVTDALNRGARIGKVHLQVGDFDPRVPELVPVWGLLAEAGVPVVIHAGSGPVPGRHTGVAPVADLLRRHSGLVLVVAHMGGTEFEGFLELAERRASVHLDTTMVFTDFFEDQWPYPRELLPRVVGIADQVLFGSDFPSIPYSYRHAVDAILRLGLGVEVERAILWHNAATLLRLET